MSNQLVNYQRIEKAIDFLNKNFTAQPNLNVIAENVNLSPFRFHRIFKDWVGISPKKFLQYLTLDHLREKIHETSNNIEAAELVGLSSQSRVHELFVTIESVTPQQFKTSGLGLDIYYGYHATPFGMCFIAITNKGICGLNFIDEDRRRDEFSMFTHKWHFANLLHRPDLTQPYIQKIFKPYSNEEFNFHLLVQGSNFQLKVWEALLKIPFGSVASFQEIATKIGYPNAARAVGSAVGKNPVSYFIPCHRIISINGTMGEYHLGKARKMCMIGWEMAKKESGKNRIG